MNYDLLQEDNSLKVTHSLIMTHSESKAINPHASLLERLRCLVHKKVSTLVWCLDQKQFMITTCG